MNFKKQIWYSTIILIGIYLLLSCISNRNEKLTHDKSKKVINAEAENSENTNKFMDYESITLPRLIGMSDIVVIGSVSTIKEDIFKFQITEFLINNNMSKLIDVEKFDPSPFFVSKLSPYAKDQQFVLFLKKPKQDDINLSWEIIGLAGEGEMPVEKGFVYFEGSNLEGLKRETYNIQGVSGNVQRFDLTNFKEAVKKYNDCFSWNFITRIKNNKKRGRWTVSKKCSETDINKYQTKSWLHKYLVKETINKISKSY